TCGNVLDFFFQAEDGIRDSSVTGVQTCALPIFPRRRSKRSRLSRSYRRLWSSSRRRPRPYCSCTGATVIRWKRLARVLASRAPRSEERRVGKECGSRGARLPGKGEGRSGGHIRV